MEGKISSDPLNIPTRHSPTLTLLKKYEIASVVLLHLIRSETATLASNHIRLHLSVGKFDVSPGPARRRQLFYPLLCLLPLSVHPSPSPPPYLRGPSRRFPLPLFPPKINIEKREANPREAIHRPPPLHEKADRGGDNRVSQKSNLADRICGGKGHHHVKMMPTSRCFPFAVASSVVRVS